MFPSGVKLFYNLSALLYSLFASFRQLHPYVGNAFLNVKQHVRSRSYIPESSAHIRSQTNKHAPGSYLNKVSIVRVWSSIIFNNKKAIVG